MPFKEDFEKSNSHKWFLIIHLNKKLSYDILQILHNPLDKKTMILKQGGQYFMKMVTNEGEVHCHCFLGDTRRK